jgi:predicted Zn-dependent protease with MMP-like domain
MSAEEFEGHVAEALDTIPADLATLIDNCVILVEDYPPPDLPNTLGL